MKSWLVILVAGLAAIAAAAWAQPPEDPAAQLAQGKKVFADRCKDCHDPAVGEAPEKAVIAKKPADEIFNTLKSGLMQPMADGLSNADMQAVAAWLTTPDAK